MKRRSKPRAQGGARNRGQYQTVSRPLDDDALARVAGLDRSVSVHSISLSSGEESDDTKKQNPFGSRTGSRERGLRPKAEPASPPERMPQFSSDGSSRASRSRGTPSRESFAENMRPWTPTSGEDFLLRTSRKKRFYPSMQIYPRPCSKVQSLVGARRGAFYPHDAPGLPQQEATPVRFLPPLRDDGFFSIQKSGVLLKNHARGAMAEYPGLEGASLSFASLALTLETELLEFNTEASRRGEPQPSITATQKAFEVLGRIADRPGSCQRVLLLIRDQLWRAVFASDAAAGPKENATSTHLYPDAPPTASAFHEGGTRKLQPPPSSDLPPTPSVAGVGGMPYFWLCQQMQDELKRMYDEDEDENQDGDDDEEADNTIAVHVGSGGGQTEGGGGRSLDETETAAVRGLPSPSSPESLSHRSQSPAAKSPQATSPYKLRRSSSSTSPRGGKSAEKLMLAKVLDLKEKIAALEEQVQELVAQNNQLQDELERRGEELESEARNAVELKGEFLRIKHENFDLKNELNVANKHNDQHFEQLQHAVSRSEHDNVVSEYKMQLDALAREHSLQLTDKFGEDGPKLDELMKTMTPRPKWRRTGTSKQLLVDCGVFARTDSSSAAVEKLIQGLMDVSDKLTSANVELAQLKGDDAVDKQNSMAIKGWSGMQVTPTVITCMGAGDDIPLFLRYNGQVRNLKMTKGKAELAVRQIWAAKEEHDRQLRIMEEKPTSNMQEFFHAHVRKKFNQNVKSMAEFAYNLIVTLRENVHDNDCKLFLDILFGDISEEVYHDEQKEMEDVMDIAAQVDRVEHDGKASGKCSKEGFLKALRVCFNKSYDQILRLKETLDVVYGHKAIRFYYADLFDDDSDFSQNEFAEEFRLQSMTARDEHKEQLRKLAKASLVKESQASDELILDVQHFMTSLRLFDPEKTEKDIKIYMHRGTSTGPGGELPARMEADAFIQNLLSRGVCKPGTLAHREKQSIHRLLSSAQVGAVGVTSSSEDVAQEDAEQRGQVTDSDAV